MMIMIMNLCVLNKHTSYLQFVTELDYLGMPGLCLLCGLLSFALISDVYRRTMSHL